jgi:hypothetical protein
MRRREELRPFHKFLAIRHAVEAVFVTFFIPICGLTGGGMGSGFIVRKRKSMIYEAEVRVRGEVSIVSPTPPCFLTL